MGGDISIQVVIDEAMNLGEGVTLAPGQVGASASLLQVMCCEPFLECREQGFHTC